MPRYFIEVAYKGTNYSGFQIQENANTIQAEVEKALNIYYREIFQLTGSSRTDAGVHAYQNFFHVDTKQNITEGVYHLNSILPEDIMIKGIRAVEDNAHCRFDAICREYQYHIQQAKNPFNIPYAYYFPYKLNLDDLNEVSGIVLKTTDFTSFSKKNTQVHTHDCTIIESSWHYEKDELKYTIKANRFLRGMVKGLVGTMLKVGRGKITVEDFAEIILAKDFAKADFSAPSKGLFLVRVNFK